MLRLPILEPPDRICFLSLGSYKILQILISHFSHSFYSIRLRQGNEAHQRLRTEVAYHGCFVVLITAPYNILRLYHPSIVRRQRRAQAYSEVEV